MIKSQGQSMAAPRSVRSGLVSLAALLLIASAVYGNGFSVPDQGARAAGQGESFAAQADDASAIYYNPAGLAPWTTTVCVSFRPLHYSHFLAKADVNSQDSDAGKLPVEPSRQLDEGPCHGINQISALENAWMSWKSTPRSG